MKRSTKKNKNRTVKSRNTIAFALILRGGKSKSHGDKRKEQSRRACRGKIRV